jgi:hypothetical protein
VTSGTAPRAYKQCTLGDANGCRMQEEQDFEET